MAQSAGEGGAAAFLVAWVVCLVTWSLPLIIAEYALGKTGRMGPIGTFVRVAGARFAWLGAFVAFVAAAIMFYYSVVAGWCGYYFLQTALRPLPTDLDAARATWDGFQGSLWPVAFHAVMMGGGALVILRGVRAIERVSLVLLPMLLGIVVLSTLRAVTLPGASAGLAFLFTPDWATLANPRIWIEALTQNAWDTGAGWGLILVYAAYMRPQDGVVKNGFLTGVGNNTVSMLAAIMVFSTVFATLGATYSQAEVLGIMQDSGPASTGLTFLWMPQLYAQMPFGRGLCLLFFLGLTAAAFTSLISMIELSARVLVDKGVPRARAIAYVAVVGFLLGIPSALNLDVLGNQDFVWGVALMLSGLFIALVVLKHGVERFRQALNQSDADDWPLPRLWSVLLVVVVPIEAVILLGWWMYLAATVYAPESWYNPLNPYSVMTCLVQWGAALLAFGLLNRWLARGVRA